MLRLAVSDMDGCLLDENGHLPPTFETTFQEMVQHGCVFACASGRGQRGIQKLFSESVNQEIATISDNGACVVYHGKTLALTLPDQDALIPVLNECKNYPGLIPVLCGVQQAYIQSDLTLDEKTTNELLKYYEGWKRIDDITVFPEPIVKVALLYFDDIETNIYPHLEKFNGSLLRVNVTAFIWIDIFNPSVNKGTGVQALQDHLGISKDETAVFGDYLNDLPMKDYATHSYAPSNAHAEVKNAFTDVIGPNTEYSVLTTISDLLNKSEAI